MAETANERKKRKRRESRARALGLHRTTGPGVPPSVKDILDAVPTMQDWKLARDLELMADAGRRGAVAGEQLRETLLENDGRCHGRTKLGMRCKNKTQGRWCGIHRKG